MVKHTQTICWQTSCRLFECVKAVFWGWRLKGSEKSVASALYLENLADRNCVSHICDRFKDILVLRDICDVLRDLVPFVQFKKCEKKTHGGVLLLVKFQASSWGIPYVWHFNVFATTFAVHLVFFLNLWVKRNSGVICNTLLWNSFSVAPSCILNKITWR